MKRSTKRSIKRANRRNDIEDRRWAWLRDKGCPNCGVAGKLEPSVIRLGGLNDYRCTACGTEGIDIMSMEGPVSHQ